VLDPLAVLVAGPPARFGAGYVVGGTADLVSQFVKTGRVDWQEVRCQATAAGLAAAPDLPVSRDTAFGVVVGIAAELKC
jgi:hypothetical protein